MVYSKAGKDRQLPAELGNLGMSQRRIFQSDTEKASAGTQEITRHMVELRWAEMGQFSTRASWEQA